MKVTTWVEFSQEVEIEIGADDVSAALSEAFARLARDIDDHPNRYDVTGALGAIGQFLRALKDEHIAQLNDAQRKVVRDFLLMQGARF